MAIEKGPQTFPKKEYLRRIAEVKAEMTRRDVTAFFISNPANITYLTGYTAKSAYVPQGIVVSMDDEEPTFILRRMDAPAAIHQTFMGRERIVGYPETLVGNPDQDGYDAVIDFLAEAGLAECNLGLELYQVPAQSAEKFRARLPKVRIVDCGRAVTWIRLIKSDLEIAYMKQAAAIADAGIMRAAEVIRPGVREADIMAEVAATLARGVNGKPGTDFASMFLCSSPRTGTCHIRWSEDTIREGSQVNLEIGGVRHGYVAPIMRTYSVGAPSERLRSVHEAELEGLEAALSVVRPGVTCSDVANAFNRTIQKHGLKKDSRCGYAIGIDWTEATASLQDGDMTELKPNMAFHLMLGNWLDEDFGYAISESFRVTDSGVEVLTAAPRKLFVL